jgi:Gas vesicle protein
MHHSTEFATDTDLLDRIMEKGIVVEAWDRVDLAGIDLTGMRVTVSRMQLFTEGMNPPFRGGHFLKTKP